MSARATPHATSTAPWALLVSPGRSITTSPPLGLLSLAAVLEQAGFKVRVVEPSVDGANVASILREALRPPLFVGVTARTSTFPALREVVTVVRRVSPHAKVVIGGVHVSALPQRSLLEAGADLAVRGEGETTLQAIAEGLREGVHPSDLSTIPGVVARVDGQAVTGPEPDELPNLCALPQPAWHQVDLDRYSAVPWQLVRRGRRIAPIITSRGCPFDCVFCAARTVSGRRLRFRDPEAVADEVAWLVGSRGVDEIQIADDNFNADEQHAAAVCEALLRRNLRVPWKTPNGVRVDRLSDSLLDLMTASGCYQLGFGIESGDPDVLRAARKRLDLDQAWQNIRRASQRGISTFGYFVVGLPGDTRQTVRRSIRWACQSALDHVHVAPMVPYPGSEVFRHLPEEHPLRGDWSRYTHQVAFDTPTLSARAVRQAIREFYLRFYAHPRRAAGLLWSLRTSSWSAFLSIAKGYLLD